MSSAFALRSPASPRARAGLCAVVPTCRAPTTQTVRRLFVLALLVTGCGDSGVADAGRIDSPPPAARVELGTGRSSFVPIPDEAAELELVAGPQGGWHLDVTARIWNVSVDGLVITYEAARAGEAAPIHLPTTRELSTSRVLREDDHWLRVGDFLQLDITGPADVIGAELDIRAHVLDPAGRTAEHTRRALVVDRD